jgi:hypothetical protein
MRKLETTVRGLFFALLAMVLTLALAPDFGGTSVGGFDKVKHACAFAALAAVGRVSFESRVWLPLGLVIFGLAIEFLQALPFIGKDMSAADVVADAIGVLFGMTLAEIAGLRRRWSALGESR